MSADSASAAVRAVQTLFMAPVLAAFLVGSLPVLLPVVLYRTLARNGAAAALPPALAAESA